MSGPAHQCAPAAPCADSGLCPRQHGTQGSPPPREDCVLRRLPQADGLPLSPGPGSELTRVTCFVPRSSQAGRVSAQGRVGVSAEQLWAVGCECPGGGEEPGREDEAGECPECGADAEGPSVWAVGGRSPSSADTDPACSGVQAPVPGFLPRSCILGSPGLWLGVARRLFRSDQGGGTGSGQLPKWVQRGRCRLPCDGRRVGTRSRGPG